MAINIIQYINGLHLGILLHHMVMRAAFARVLINLFRTRLGRGGGKCIQKIKKG